MKIQKFFEREHWEPYKTILRILIFSDHDLRKLGLLHSSAASLICLFYMAENGGNAQIIQ